MRQVETCSSGAGEWHVCIILFIEPHRVAVILIVTLRCVSEFDRSIAVSYSAAGY